MGEAAREKLTFFANHVIHERHGHVVRLLFGLRATHGRHAGETTPIVHIAVTSQCANDLAQKLARDHD